MRRLIRGSVLVGTLAVAAAGCDPQNVNTGSPIPTPTVPVTETFSGTLTVNGSQTFAFQALGSGTVQATIKTFSPETDAKVGLAVGVYNGVTCATSPALTNDTAGQGITVTAQVATAAALCVRINDSQGQMTQSNVFEITVIHP